MSPVPTAARSHTDADDVTESLPCSSSQWGLETEDRMMTLLSSTGLVPADLGLRCVGPHPHRHVDSARRHQLLELCSVCRQMTDHQSAWHQRTDADSTDADARSTSRVIMPRT